MKCYETNMHIEFNVAAGPQHLNIFTSEILLQIYCQHKSLLHLFLTKRKWVYCCSWNSYHIVGGNLGERIFSIRMKDFIMEVPCDPTKFHLQQRELLLYADLA